MKYILMAFTLFLFTCSHNQDAAKNDGYERIPSSSLSKAKCSELLKSIIGKANKYTFGALKKHVIAPTVDKLGTFTLKSRLQFLKMLNARRGRVKILSDLYASTINGLIRKGFLSKEEVPALLAGNGNSKYLLDFTYGEVRVIPKAWDGLPDLDKTMDLLLARTQPSSHDVIQLRKMLSETEFTPLEFNEFQKYFVRFPETDEEWLLLKEYLDFASAMRSKKQIQAMAELPKLFYKNDNGKHVNKFRKIRKSIDKYESKQLQKQEKKALKKGMGKDEAKAFAKEEAERMTKTYSGLKYACRSTKPTAESKQAAKTTSAFFMGMGITATAGTYMYANWDKDKSHFDWYGKLGHDLAWKFIFQFGYNKIMTDQSATFLSKMISLHVFYTPADAIEAGMYQMEFGEENSFIKEEYARILKLKKENDPEFIKTYNDAMSSLNHEYMPEKLKRYIRKLTSGEIEPPKDEFDEILSIDDITSGELEDSEMQERLMEAITLKLYNENAGSVKLGSHFMDRYIFVRSYDMLDVPKGLMMGLWIYRTMCMGGMNMKAAITQASIIYTVDQVLSKFMYYSIRRDVINM